MTYNYIHLGTSTKTLVDLAEGKNPFFEKLKNAKTPMVLIGANVLNRADGEAILDHIKKLSLNTNILNKYNGWNGYNILHQVIFFISSIQY